MLEDYESLDEESLLDLFYYDTNDNSSCLVDSLVELLSSSIKSSSTSLKEVPTSRSNKIDDQLYISLSPTSSHKSYSILSLKVSSNLDSIHCDPSKSSNGKCSKLNSVDIEFDFSYIPSLLLKELSSVEDVPNDY